MTHTKDEALKLALGKIKAARDCHFAAIDTLLFEAEELLDQALAAPTVQPVAITTGMALAFHRATSDGSISDAEAKEIKLGLEAAFAHITTPPAAQPAERTAVPLTEPELRAVLEKTNHMITNTMRGPFWPELEQACRAIEAAHGIGVSK